jgi:Flp pilus assembly protein CpaB
MTPLRTVATLLLVLAPMALQHGTAYSGDGAADYDPTAPRRVGVEMRDFRGVAGFLTKGERVDIMLKRELPGAPPTCETLVRNVRVIDAIHSVEEGSGYQLVWLDVDQKEAYKVWGSFGRLWLARRNAE